MAEKPPKLVTAADFRSDRAPTSKRQELAIAARTGTAAEKAAAGRALYDTPVGLPKGVAKSGLRAFSLSDLDKALQKARVNEAPRSKEHAIRLARQHGLTPVDVLGSSSMAPLMGADKPDLLKAYKEAVGRPAPKRAENKWLWSEIQRAGGVPADFKPVAAPKSAPVVAPPPRPVTASAKGIATPSAKTAPGPRFGAVAPLLGVLSAVQSYNAEREAGASRFAAGAAAAVQTGAGFAAAAVLGGYALPVFAGIGAVRGAIKEGTVVGAARGALAAVDVSTLLTGFSSTDKRGVLERGLDRVVTGSHLNATARSRDPADNGTGNKAKTSVPSSTKVSSYQRTYTKGLKAGTTETVRLAA